MMQIDHALWLFLIGCLGALAVQYVAYRSSFARARGGGFQVRRNVVVASAFGVVLALASRLFSEDVVWLFTAFTFVFLIVTRVREVAAWRHFFGQLDAVCVAADESHAEMLLSLRERPSERSAHERWYTRIFLASYRAHELDCTDRALRWLDAPDEARLPPSSVLTLRLYRVALSLSLGRREAARAVLSQIPARLPVSNMEEAAAANRMLLAILDGAPPPGALTEVRARRAREKSRYADAWNSIEAHLLAAQGDEHAARASLRELRARSGDIPLRRVGRQGGPASSLALRLDEDAPYR